MGTKQIDDGQWSGNFPLEDLKVFLEFVRAQEADSDLTMHAHTETGAGGKREYKRLERSMSRIEDAIGCDLVHVDRAGRRTSNVTLDGQVWAEFADLVVVLYEMTRSGIDHGPKKAATHRPRVHIDPTVGRRNILAWLRHQNAEVLKARHLSEHHSVPLCQTINLIAKHEVQVEELDVDMKWGELAPVLPDHDKWMESEYGGDIRHFLPLRNDVDGRTLPKAPSDSGIDVVHREEPPAMKRANASLPGVPDFWFHQRYRAHVLPAPLAS